MYKENSLRRTISPVLPPTVLHRTALINALKEAIVDTPHTAKRKVSPYKLVLLCAPAGYGKTTLLVDFAEQTSFPCCWYVLDNADDDQIAFLELLIISIRQCFPHFGTKLDPWLNSAVSADTGTTMQQCLNVLIEGLISAIAEIPERFALIICNYHKVNQNQEINNLLSQLLHQLPSQCIVILESRAMPDLELAPLLARREVFGLGISELRFNIQEIRALAQLQNIDLTEDEAKYLEQSFDGWIAGTLLGTRLGDLRNPLFNASIDDTWKAPALKMDRKHLFAYLIKEVFAREAEAYEFLKEAVVLRQMTPSLCSALLDIPDIGTRLAYLEQQGLFVTHYNDKPEKYYVCHPVLRTILYNELSTSAPQRLVELHLRAVDILRGKQDEEAIYHAFAAEAYEVAGDLIKGICKQLFAQGHYTTLVHWIDALPAQVMQFSSQLLLVRANIYLVVCEPMQAKPLLDRAFELVEQDTEVVPEFRSEILLARALMLTQQGDFASAQDLCQHVLALLPADAVELRAAAHERLGICANFLNDLTTSTDQLQQALQLYGHNTETHHVAKLHTQLADAYFARGLHTLSEHHRTRAIQCWEYLNDERGKINNLVGLGVAKLRKGAFAEAEQTLTIALTASRGTVRYKRGEAYTLVNLGDLYQQQNKYQQALPFYEDAIALARQQKDTYLLNFTLCALATTYQLLGDSQTALLIISQIDKSKGLQGYEHALYEMTMGIILLMQQQPGEALDYLTSAETAWRIGAHKLEQMQTQIRIAACLQAQGNKKAALELVQNVLLQGRKISYERLVEIELKRFHDLQQLFEAAAENLSEDDLSNEMVGSSDARESSRLSSLSLTQAQKRLSTLRIQALGEPIIMINDVPVKRWRMARSMELFFLLLDADRPLRKERIVTSLWSEVDERTDQTLRSTLYYLRKALGTLCIISNDGAYSLDLSAEYGEKIWYDVSLFQKLNATAQAALSENDDVAANQAFEEMLRLYQGDFLQPFYGNWCITRRDELRQVYLNAHQQLAHIAWHQQQLEKAINHWQHMLAIDSSLEIAHRGLMRCYMQQGKREAALRQYKHCETSLHNELGIAPALATQQLYRRIVQHPSQQ